MGWVRLRPDRTGLAWSDLSELGRAEVGSLLFDSSSLLSNWAGAMQSVSQHYGREDIVTAYIHTWIYIQASTLSTHVRTLTEAVAWPAPRASQKTRTKGAGPNRLCAVYARSIQGAQISTLLCVHTCDARCHPSPHSPSSIACGCSYRVWILLYALTVQSGHPCQSCIHLICRLSVVCPRPNIFFFAIANSVRLLSVGPSVGRGRIYGTDTRTNGRYRAYICVEMGRRETCAFASMGCCVNSFRG